MDDIKKRAVRGGMVTVVSHAMNVILRTGSMAVMARLILPEDFGLVGMVTAVTGVLSLFKDAGLSAATVQRATITDEQLSTIFWINIAIGFILFVTCLVMAPFMVAFYRDSRLYWVTVALSTAFLFNAASSQHGALLHRQLRYTAFSVIGLTSLIISIVVGVVMALGGFAYWSLVGAAIAQPAAGMVCFFLATKWVPGLPRWNGEARSMLHFGGTITLNNLVGYVTYNLDKVLLGRFSGAEALGYYGRAYQLVSLPTEGINSTVGGVAFASLSRIQSDPHRLENYFLKGYSLVLVMTIPITITCGLFGEDLIYFVLGPKWKDSIDIFRIFSPTILAFAFINPFGWFLFSTGRVVRSLKIALAIAPSLFLAYVVGMQFGAAGMATGFSIVMVLWIVPAIAWAKHGSGISARDVLQAVKAPLISGIMAGAFAFAAQHYVFSQLEVYQRLLLEVAILMASYAYILLYVMNKKELIYGVIADLKHRSPS